MAPTTLVLEVMEIVDRLHRAGGDLSVISPEEAGKILDLVAIREEETDGSQGGEQGGEQ